MELPSFFPQAPRLPFLPSALTATCASAVGFFLLPGIGSSANDAKETNTTEDSPPASEKIESIVVPPEDRKGCVWEVKDDDNTVYLAGSVHLLRESDYPVSPVYDQAYGDSESIVMEIDMGEMMNPEGLLRMQQLGTYQGEDSLEKHLKPETIKRLQAYLQTHESGPMIALALPKLKPGMVFMTISSLEAMRLDARPDLGLEMVYYQKAQEDGKPVTGLETVEYQMTRFDSMSDDELETLILKTLDEIDEMAGMIDKIIAGWHEGDIEKLDGLLNEEPEEDAKVRELLLTERNANWIPHIEEAIDGDTNTLFLVGAAHLIGKDSVIDFLEQKGYEVNQIMPEAPAEAEPAKSEPKKAKKDKAA